MSLQIQRLERSAIWVKMAIAGPSGAGKTYSALQLAQHLCDGRILVIDSEQDSAKLYGDKIEQGRADVINLPSHSPQTYIQAINLAKSGRYEAIIIDSLSHAWMGKDGALEQVDKKAASMKGNSYAAWKDISPLFTRLVDELRAYPGHVIATLRSKTEYLQEKDKNGRTTITRVGLAPVFRDGIEYEFDVFGEIDHEHRLLITKSRMEEIQDELVQRPGREFAHRIREWANPSGEKPADARDVAVEMNDAQQSAAIAEACEFYGIETKEAAALKKASGLSKPEFAKRLQDGLIEGVRAEELAAWLSPAKPSPAPAEAEEGDPFADEEPVAAPASPELTEEEGDAAVRGEVGRMTGDGASPALHVEEGGAAEPQPAPEPAPAAPEPAPEAESVPEPSEEPERPAPALADVFTKAQLDGAKLAARRRKLKLEDLLAMAAEEGVTDYDQFTEYLAGLAAVRS